ncbi:MAG TPA: hypothetical protein PLI09_14385 [Candidatus Hydrogenedentes bacterium]|nr:hypothetical protein [Candidatus Hydrogenedentota bacterium]
MRLFGAVLVLAVIAGLCFPLHAQSSAHEKSACDVVLSWDNTGDFGPQTPNTKTSGWQEAIDYCVANAHDLYVKGGWGGRKPIYNISVPIHIPATQDFRINGGVYVMNWTGPAGDPSQDLLVIDSVMNGEFHFGILVYGGAGAAMRIKPEKPVPIDNFTVMVETEITSQGMADPAPFTPGERKAGSGLVLDATKAPIVSSRFDFIGGILNFKTCVDIQGNFTQNHFQCLHLHTNADKSHLLALGPESSQNVFQLTIGVDQGASEVTGLDIFGFNNKFAIMTRGGFPKTRDIILEEKASGNHIELMHGKKDGFDPADFITDNASTPTNHLKWIGPAPAPIKIAAPAGTFTHIQRLYPAIARVTSSADAKFNVIRDNSGQQYPALPSTDILLRVGDQLQIGSSAPSEIILACMALD